MRVKEAMNKAIVVDHDLTIKEAAKIMSDKNIGSLIAIKGKKILGIITEKDVVDNIGELGRKVSSLMTKKVITVGPDEDTDNAAMLMAKNKVKRIPVVDEDDQLVGIVTATDLIAHSDDLNEDFFFD